MSTIKSGDRVRVTIEGSWGSTEGDAWTLEEGEVTGFDRPKRIIIRDDDVITIEKVEEPVEVFQPGDIVRAKDFPDIVFVLAHKGYLDLYNDGIWNEYLAGRKVEFTSKDYERVEI